jgi:hypothetical protein
MMTKKVEVKRWEFEHMSGTFELRRAGWVRVIGPNNDEAIIHRDQIMAMAETLKGEENPP